MGKGVDGAGADGPVRGEALSVTRQPPVDLEAEAAVLGSLMLDPEPWHEVRALLEPTDFYKEAHRTLFRAIEVVVERGDFPDLVTLTGYLRDRGELERVGSAVALVGLMDGVPSAAFVDQYARAVREKARLRGIITVASQALQGAYDAAPSGEVVEGLEDGLRKVTQVGASEAVVHASEAVARVEALMRLYEENRGVPVGVPTGLRDVDKFLSGWQDGRLYVLAARPGMGKTALALQAAVHAALAGVPVAFASLEMSPEELMMRASCAEARVDMERVKNGELGARDWDRMDAANARLREAPLYLLDTPDLSVAQFRAEARRLVTKHGVRLLVVDYLSLMTASRQRGGSYENRVQEVSAISRGLKVAARELDVPVLALSQLSRAVESRADKHPMLSDLRESGSVEQDADVVMFLYRDDYYDPHSEKQGVAELMVAKHRNGPTGKVELQWTGAQASFKDLYRDRAAPAEAQASAFV